MFSLSFLYTTKTTELNRAREVLSTLESDFAGYAWIDEELVLTKKLNKDMASELESAKAELENSLPTDKILRRLPGLMPEGVRLVQFSLTDNGIIMFHGEATSLSGVAGLVVSLEQSDLFDDIKLLKTTRVNESEKIYEFEATGKLSPTGGD